MPVDDPATIPESTQRSIAGEFLAGFFGRYFQCSSELGDFLTTGGSSGDEGYLEDHEPYEDLHVTPCELPSAECGCRQRVTFASGDGLSLPRRYSNPTHHDVTLTMTTNDSVVFGPAQEVSSRVLPAETGVWLSESPVAYLDASTSGGQDLVVIETTSNISGSLGLGRCEYEVLALGTWPLSATRDMVVRPVDVRTGDMRMTLTFAEVSVPGFTTASSTRAGPPPPAGHVEGDPALTFEVTTAAEHVGPVEVCVSYSGIAFGDPARLELFAFEESEGTWLDRTSSLDTASEVVCAEVDSLSSFAIFEHVNDPPVADAGTDLEVECTCGDGGGTPLTLDGSGSYDPDGDALTYLWTGPFAPSPALGVAPTVALVDGCPDAYEVTLVVDDGMASSEPDHVTATVRDTLPPEVSIENPPAGGSVEGQVTLAASSRDSCRGTERVWFTVREDHDGLDVPIGYEGVLGVQDPASGAWEADLSTTELSDGAYVVFAGAEDAAGHVGWSEVVSFDVRNWTVVSRLPPSSEYRAGRTVPIAFSLRFTGGEDPQMPFVRNEDLEVRILDLTAGGAVVQASFFGGSASSYRIDDREELYLTNFPSSARPALVAVEVRRADQDFVLGSFSFETVGP